MDARLGMGLGKKLLPGRGKLCRAGHHICRVARIFRIVGLGNRGRGRVLVPESARLRRTARVPTGERELVNAKHVKIYEKKL